MTDECLEDFFLSRYGPTHVMQFGLPELITGSNRNAFEGVQRVIIFVPGNPGTVKCYQHFLQTLYSNLKVPVIGFSHVGHTPYQLSKVPGNITVTRQINHKLDLIHTYVPENVEIIFVSHSIGSYITLQVMKSLSSQRVKHSFLLFPAIERMRILDHSKKISLINNYMKYIILLFLYVVGKLSRKTQEKVLLFLQPSIGLANPCLKEGSLDLISPKIAKNILYMAEDEFIQVEELDERLIEDNINKLTFIYAKDDGWAPYEYYLNMKKKFPAADVRLEDAQHGFIMTEKETQCIAGHIVTKVKSFNAQ
ncbi:Lipid droplet-associated hydrolase [Halotydeus destructor]|nr:Lipid droplet-associated hydrolase [Halotydeus destructor]